ncbi:hypothetical protein BH23BAC3_BH23BAC3_03230 [soil metagenome]
MRKSIFILITITFLFSCNSLPEDLRTDHVSDIFPEIFVSEKYGLYTDRNGEPQNGTFLSKFSDGSKHAKLKLVDGMITDGFIRLQNGDINSDYSSIDGRIYHTVYQENGEPVMLTVYEGDYNQQKEFHVWHENGAPLVQITNSMMRTWYENGQLQMQMPLKNGKIHGKSIAWHKNGKLRAENHFTDDVMDGRFKEWDEEGNLIQKHTYEMGQLITEK